MLKKLIPWAVALLVTAVLIVMVSIQIANTVPRVTPAERTPRWSLWSIPEDTTTNGWYRERGVIQYRTNLDTGLVERRTVQ